MSGLSSFPFSQELSANLVGDIIVSARSLCPDPTSQLRPPVTGDFTLSAGTGSIPAGIYYVAMSWKNNWGETTATEQSITLSVAGSILVTVNTTIPNVTPNIYWGTASQAENQVQLSAVSPFSIASLSGNVYQGLPFTNSAWLPDTDGLIVLASTMFGWLNQGLDQLSRSIGGILDRSGIGTVGGRGSYTLPTQWTKITNLWYDGWPCVSDYRKNMFYYNAIAGIPSIWTMNQVAGRVTLEIWPQAERTANQTTLAASIGESDLVIPVINTNPTADTNVVDIGVIMMNDPAQHRFPEWCFFTTQTGTSYNHITRGTGGSRPQTWAAGTPIFECNAMFAGYRMATHYFVGESSLPLDCPPNWDNALTDWLLYRYKQATQQGAEAKDYLSSFMAKVKEMANQKNISKRNRLPKFDSGPPGVYPLGPFGSVIVP